jgi:polyphosphate kinase 2 (PPK2 family)
MYYAMNKGGTQSEVMERAKPQCSQTQALSAPKDLSEGSGKILSLFAGTRNGGSIFRVSRSKYQNVPGAEISPARFK